MKKLVLLCLWTITLSGCISYRSDGSNGRQQISGIRSGETTVDWLEDQLGTPMSVRKTRMGSEIWHYRFSEKEKTHVSLFLIFSVSNENTSSTDYYFEIVDGVVDSFWQE